MSEPSAPLRSPGRSWFVQISQSGWMGWFFWCVLASVVVLLIISGYGAFVSARRDYLHLAFLGGLAGFAATALGAIVAIILRDIASRTQDIMLGFAAGMMLAASSFSLILPGIEAAQQISNNQLLAASIVVLGLGWGWR
jgi:ZIP family zinc transporter